MSLGRLSRILTLISLLGVFLPLVSAAEMMPAWLLVSLKSEASIITTDGAERDKLVGAGWKVDASGSLTSEGGQGAGALHRLWRSTPQGTDRLLETDATQLPALVKSGYTDEGSVGYVAAETGPGRVPVYQFRKGEKRLWVASEAMQSAATDAGWKLQGIHFWLWPSGAK